VKINNTGTGYTTAPHISIIADKFNYPVVKANLVAILNTGTGASAGAITFVPELIGQSAQGCGYYLRTSDSQNIRWANAVGNIGNLVIEGALATNPTDGDWVVAGYSNIGVATIGTTNGSFSVSGRFINIRARIENYGNGTISSVTADY